MGSLEPLQHLRTAAAAGPESADLAREYLTFGVGDESYAIDILRVQEIRNYEAPTRIVGAPAAVKGVIDLRGVVVPIVDLRTLFGIAQPRFDEFTVVVILDAGGRVIGAVVDSVGDVVSLDAARIKPAPRWDGATGGEFVSGLGTLVQGSLESSNVNVVEEMVNMIQIQRAYEMNSKAVQTCDQMLQFASQNM